MKIDLIRPSTLPKLQECRCYQSNPVAGEAAARGTRIDALIRKAYATKQGLFGLDLQQFYTEEQVDEPADRAAIKYAVDTLTLLSHGEPVATEENLLAAAVPVDGVKAGTMDALCVAENWLADFKTGQIRDYRAQMAAYALACMDDCFAENWTAHLIFVDQQKTITHEFTRAEAEQIVRDIVAAPQEPTLCDYCAWCAGFETCPLTRQAAADVTAHKMQTCTPAMKSQKCLPPSMEDLLADHAKAHAYLQKLKIANDWADIMKSRLKESLQQLPEDEKSPYFSLVVTSGSKKVNPLALAKYGMEFGFDRLLAMCSQIPLDKVLEQWQIVFKNTPFPEELIQTAGGSVSIRLKKPSKK